MFFARVFLLIAVLCAIFWIFSADIARVLKIRLEESSPYQTLIRDAALHQFGTFPQTLTTIDTPVVRMVVYTTFNGYQRTDKALQATIWATVEPELQKHCQAYVKTQPALSRKQLRVWLAQLLGLPAKNAEDRRFVILQVPAIQAYYGIPARSIGIFRPCTDPRIQRHRDGSAICPAQMNAADRSIAADYKTWFINTSIAFYTLKNDQGFPWSQYGYTLNWNPAAASVYGVAEFVLLKETPVTVLPNPLHPNTPYISPEQYCTAP